MSLRNEGSNDSFADATPIQADGTPVVEAAPAASANPNEPSTEQVQPSNVDSFDGPEMTEEEMQTKIEEMRSGKNDQTKKLDEEEVKDEKKEDEKEPEKEPEKEEEKEPEKEEVKDEKPAGKTIRMKDGDKATDISLEATVPVKIKGKKEFVSIQELRENFSGKQAWTEEIETAKTAQKDAEHLTQRTVAERQEIMGHLSKISEMMDADDFDPIKPLAYLVEKCSDDLWIGVGS